MVRIQTCRGRREHRSVRFLTGSGRVPRAGASSVVRTWRPRRSAGAALNTSTRIVLADADARSRDRTRRALGGQGFEVVGEAADAAGAGAVDLAVRWRPDLCLFDVDLPGGGVRATAEVKVALADTVVVMYTDSARLDDLLEALRAGAQGYLFKDTDEVRLPLALKGALAGEAAVPRRMVAKLLDEVTSHGVPRRRALPGHADISLSPREWEVLELLRHGLTTAEVADRLYVAPVTVRAHVARVVRKLRVKDRHEAVALLRSHQARCDL